MITKLDGEFISKRMKELNLTKLHVSEKSGISRPTLNAYIKNLRKPHEKNLFKLLKVLRHDGDENLIIYASVLNYSDVVNLDKNVSDIDTSGLEKIVLPRGLQYDYDKDFIIKVNTDIMLKKSHKSCLYPNEYLVVDTQKAYSVHDVVVAYLEKEKQVIIRLLSGENNNLYLEPLNERYINRKGYIVHKNDFVHIKGVVKAVITPMPSFRKLTN